MQFIEANVLGVRAAHYRLVSPRYALEFRLFPMIHIGAPEFYAEVGKQLRACDAILFEGARSRKARLLASSYMLIARRKHLGLVTQRAALPLRSLGVRLIHADSAAEELAADWSAIPWRSRVGATLGAPLYGLWMFMTATRELLGQHMQTEDLESRDFQDAFENWPELEKMLVTHRDSRLVSSLASLIANPGQTSRAAVVYGAGHMRVVTRFLLDVHDYRVVESRWIDVFRYDR